MNEIIQSVYKSADPKVGMPATFMFYSDREPGTVAKIISPKKIVVIRCDWEVVGGPYEYGANIEYKFNPGTIDEIKEAGENAHKNGYSIYTLRKNGKWILQGVDMHAGGSSVMLGSRDKYYDPHF